MSKQITLIVAVLLASLPMWGQVRPCSVIAGLDVFTSLPAWTGNPAVRCVSPVHRDAGFGRFFGKSMYFG